MEVPKKLKLTFRIQKNRQKGQSITLMAEDAHLDICPVWAAYRIYLRAKKWVNRIQSQWAYSSTNLASKIISREVRLPRYYDLSQRESIRTGPPTNWNVYHWITYINALGQRLGPRTFRWSRHESSLHDITITQDGRFIRAVLAWYLHLTTQAHQCPLKWVWQTYETSWH